jgi:hypothetical protein
MSEFTLEREFSRIGGHTRHSIAISAVLHALLLLLLGLYHATSGDTAGLTEITWIEASVPEGVPDAAPPVADEETQSAPVREVQAVATREAERAFQRAEREPSRRACSRRGPTDIFDERISAIENNARQRDAPGVAGAAAEGRVPALAGGRSEPPVRNDCRRSSATLLPRKPFAALRRTKAHRRAPSWRRSSATVRLFPPHPPCSRKIQHARPRARNHGPVADRAVLSYQVPATRGRARGHRRNRDVVLFVLPDGQRKRAGRTHERASRTSTTAPSKRCSRGIRRAAGQRMGRITFHCRLGVRVERAVPGDRS